MVTGPLLINCEVNEYLRYGDSVEGSFDQVLGARYLTNAFQPPNKWATQLKTCYRYSLPYCQLLSAPSLYDTAVNCSTLWLITTQRGFLCHHT